MAPAARQSSSRVNCASDGGAAANPPPVPRAGCPAAAAEPAAPTPAPAGPGDPAPAVLGVPAPGVDVPADPAPEAPAPAAAAPEAPAPAPGAPAPRDPVPEAAAPVVPAPEPRPRAPRRPAPARGARPTLVTGGTWRALPLQAADLLEVGEALADDAQGEVLVALGAEDEAEAGDVVLGELAVAGGRAVGLDQAGALEEADLGDGDVGELGLEDPQHLADAHRPGGAGLLGRLAGAGGVSSTAARPGRHVALDRIPHSPTRHPRVDCRRRRPA